MHAHVNAMFTFASLGQFCPHLLDPLQHHVAVPVEGLHSPQQLLVVPAVDEDLGVVLHGVREHPERPGGELLLLLGVPLLRSHVSLARHPRY